MDRRSTIEQANMSNAILIGADLRGADMTGVTGLEPKQIELAVTDHTTKLPSYLSHEKSIL